MAKRPKVVKSSDQKTNSSFFDSRPDKQPYCQNDSNQLHANRWKDEKDRRDGKQNPFDPTQGRPDVSDQESGEAGDSETGQSSCLQDLRECSMKEKCGLKDKGKGDEKPCDAKLEGFDSCRHHLRTGQIGRRKSCDCIRRRKIRKHSVVEDKEVGG